MRSPESVAHAAQLQFTVLDPEIFGTLGVLDGLDGQDAPLETSHRPVSKGAAVALRRSIAYVRDHVMPATEAPLVTQTAAQHVAANVLHAFPHAGGLSVAREYRTDAHPETLRRATAYIDSNPAAALTVADIANAACVTPRALQLTFRRHLGTTPLGYLRRVRLQHAHQELRSADGAIAGTVTAIAYKWGFSSPSRFAEYYRAAYGESPSATLSS